jgi:hypothetical protein
LQHRFCCCRCVHSLTGLGTGVLLLQCLLSSLRSPLRRRLTGMEERTGREAPLAYGDLAASAQRGISTFAPPLISHGRTRRSLLPHRRAPRGSHGWTMPLPWSRTGALLSPLNAVPRGSLGGRPRPEGSSCEEPRGWPWWRVRRRRRGRRGNRSAGGEESVLRKAAEVTGGNGRSLRKS